MEIKENRRLLYLTAFEDALNDFVAVKRLCSVFKDIGNDIGHSSLREAPAVEGIDAAADEYEALVFNKFVMNCLGRDIFSLEVTVFDGVSNFREVKRLLVFSENNVNFVANIFRVHCRPFYESPVVLEVCEKLADTSKSAYMIWVLVGKLLVKLLDSKGFAVFFDRFDDLVYFGTNLLFVPVFGNTDRMVVIVIFIDDRQVW
ncbi:hypothetical protein D3C87_1555330 [compost metagenome]